MRLATTRLRLERELAGVLEGGRDSVHFCAPPASRPETMPTGIPEVDALTGGLPKGHITEVTGMTSSGRTSLLLSVLAQASRQDEVSGFIDPGDVLDPVSAAAFGVDLERLLWIRARRAVRHIDQVLKITDLLLQGGGFGLIGVDLSELPSGEVRRIPSSLWFRLQRAARNTPTVLLLLNRESILKTTAALALRMDVAHAEWSGRFLREVRPGARILRSRRDPLSQGRARVFRLYPAACIEAGFTQRAATNPVSHFIRPGGVIP